MVEDMAFAGMGGGPITLDARCIVEEEIGVNSGSGG